MVSWVELVSVCPSLFTNKLSLSLAPFLLIEEDCHYTCEYKVFSQGLALLLNIPSTHHFQFVAQWVSLLYCTEL